MRWVNIVFMIILFGPIFACIFFAEDIRVLMIAQFGLNIGDAMRATVSPLIGGVPAAARNHELPNRRRVEGQEPTKKCK